VIGQLNCLEVVFCYTVNATLWLLFLKTPQNCL